VVVKTLHKSTISPVTGRYDSSHGRDVKSSGLVTAHLIGAARSWLLMIPSLRGVIVEDPALEIRSCLVMSGYRSLNLT
jgi:hypothetical protein